jgi:TonB family protein
MRILALLAGALALACASSGSGATTSPGSLVFGGAQAGTSCAGLVSTDSAVYDTAQVTELPQLRSGPMLQYPGVAFRRHENGSVTIAMIIEPDGRVQQGSLRIVQSTDTVFDAAALRFAKGTSWWPACRDGQPVRIMAAQPIHFLLPRRR